LKKNGVEAVNVTGGILGWIGANLPIKVGTE
jgi:rhodanese-related sulfurtransferase